MQKPMRQPTWQQKKSEYFVKIETIERKKSAEKDDRGSCVNH
jgi:hypothetical protein